MKTRHPRPSGAARPGFTLIEVMIATTITLVLMGLVVQIFATVGNSVSETRSTIQMIDRLRSARQTMQSDLAGITCAGMMPPLDKDSDFGYLEIVEGPIGSRFFSSAAPMIVVTPAGTTLSVTSPTPPGDTTLGDIDDMIMFTTRTEGNPFVGRYFLANGIVTKATTTTSEVAEVCYFLRGTTLYRRSLLVKPGLSVLTSLGFYGQNDVSVHQEGGPFDRSPNPINPGAPQPARLVANSLSDLTKRENRYGHQPFAFPFDARFWGPLGLPTLRECTYFQGAIGSGTGTWPFPLFDPANFSVWSSTLAGPAGTYVIPSPPNPPQQFSTVPSSLNTFPQIPQLNLTLTAGGVFDAWPLAFPLTGAGAGMQTPYPWDQTTFPTQTAPINPMASNVEPNGAIYGFSASNTPASMQPAGNLRFSDDVILTNVLSFDVKVWDAEAPIVAHPGLDGQPGVASFDDDHNGTADDISELGAAGSDDIVWQPGDIYPDLMLPANLQGFSTSNQGFGSYNYSSVGSLTTTTAGSNNWANTQYLTVLLQALGNTTFSPTLPLIIQKGAYVDLAYAQNPAVGISLTNPFTPFCGPGDFRSLLWAGGWFPTVPPNGSFLVMPAVYDTGSTSYERDGLDEDALTAPLFGVSSFGPDSGNNQADDNNCAGVDDISGEPFTDVNNNGFFDDGAANFTDLNIPANGKYDPPEAEMPPPYRTKLHGVQIKLRVCDPDSRQIREVTIVQEFENE